MRFEAARARAYYDESRPLLDLIHPRSRAVAVGADRHLLAACWNASNIVITTCSGAAYGCRCGKSRGLSGACWWGNGSGHAGLLYSKSGGTTRTDRA